MKINVRYFAILREQSGRAAESLDTTASTPAGLYVELQQKYSFTVPLHAVRSSVNAEFVDDDTVLSEGDEVVFVPPVAGG